ncbi:hypothetical protein J4E91_002495 [Alternaria rosae]|nr:hypothetical protein J4E91_002495 [Alternaria rosae]
MHFDRDMQSMRSSGEAEALSVMRVTIRDLIQKFRDLEYPFLKPEYQSQDSAQWSIQSSPYPSEKSPYAAQYYPHSDDDDDSPSAGHMRKSNRLGLEYANCDLQRRWLWEGHGDDDSREEDELLEGERSDGGVRLPNAYIENNEDARGVEIERRNGLEPHGTLDKTIELREGETDILRVENGKSPVRQPHPLALCARTLLKLPCRQKKRTWSMCIRHLLNMNSGFCPGAVAICRAETKPLYSTQED